MGRQDQSSFSSSDGAIDVLFPLEPLDQAAQIFLFQEIHAGVVYQILRITDVEAADRLPDTGLILQDLARKESAPFEKWYLRKRAQQTVLPFVESESAIAG